MKEELIKELRTCAQKMIENTEFDKKLFLLNMSGELISSYLLFNVDEQLQFSEIVLRLSHALIDSKSNEKGDSSLLPDMRETLDKIAEQMLELSSFIEDEKNIHLVLQKRISTIYSLTDYGIYMNL